MSDEQQGSQRPTSDDDRAGWQAYWQAQRMPWRTEPEIGEERQQYLSKRRLVKPVVEKGIYPFKDVQLNRADVEWLLATHESAGMRGPVDWVDLAQRGREGLDIRGADLSGLALNGLPLARLHGGLAGDEWNKASPDQREWAAVRLTSSSVRYVRLEGAILTCAHLEGADLRECHLEGAELTNAHFEADMPAKMRLIFFDQETRLDGVTLANDQHVGPRVVDVHWGGVNLAIVDWASVSILGEEERARQKTYRGKRKNAIGRLWDYGSAVRANRQVTTVLRSQGLNEHADRFAYRAQLLQREVLRRKRRYLAWVGSAVLDGLAGYGFKPARALLVYVALIVGFAAAYFVIGPAARLPLSPLEAVVFSVTSFHGRGFSPGENVTLANPLTVLAAVEAVLGLLVEITFIATFTQRFFGSR